MHKLTVRSIGEILDARTRRKLLVLAIARIAANLFDIAGLAGIALLAATFSTFASTTTQTQPLSFPIIGPWRPDEGQAVIMALAILVMFVLKSAFSVWLSFKTASEVAGLEALHSLLLAERFFGPDRGLWGADVSISQFQNRVLHSTSAISGFINARITYLAESSLLLVLLLIFLLVNPIAAIAMFSYLALVLMALNKFLRPRIQVHGQRQMSGFELSLEISRDLFSIVREAIAARVGDFWLKRFFHARVAAAQGAAAVNTLNSLPRHVIETSLVLGIFLFLGGGGYFFRPAQPISHNRSFPSGRT